MVTLVNATTGSASELLSGALQDHGRSLIVGQQTFGKGTVQTVRPWQGSRSIMEFYTVARYYRPSGVGVQLIGIEPDIEVYERPGAAPRERPVTGYSCASRTSFRPPYPSSDKFGSTPIPPG